MLIQQLKKIDNIQKNINDLIKQKKELIEVINNENEKLKNLKSLLKFNTLKKSGGKKRKHKTKKFKIIYLILLLF